MQHLLRHSRAPQMHTLVFKSFIYFGVNFAAKLEAEAVAITSQAVFKAAMHLCN